VFLFAATTFLTSDFTWSNAVFTEYLRLATADSDVLVLRVLCGFCELIPVAPVD